MMMMTTMNQAYANGEIEYIYVLTNKNVKPQGYSWYNSIYDENYVYSISDMRNTPTTTKRNVTKYKC